MAKLRKRKTRRLRLEGIAVIMFTCALLCLMLSSLFIKTRNASLTMKIQELNAEVAALQNDNQSINIEIQTLENKDRVFVIAQAANMAQTQDNIVSVIGE